MAEEAVLARNNVTAGLMVTIPIRKHKYQEGPETNVI